MCKFSGLLKSQLQWLFARLNDSQIYLCAGHIKMISTKKLDCSHKLDFIHVRKWLSLSCNSFQNETDLGKSNNNFYETITSYFYFESDVYPYLFYFHLCTFVHSLHWLLTSVHHTALQLISVCCLHINPVDIYQSVCSDVIGLSVMSWKHWWLIGFFTTYEVCGLASLTFI